MKIYMHTYFTMIIFDIVKKYSKSVSIFQITEDFKSKSDLNEAQIAKLKVEKKATITRLRDEEE